MNPAYPGFAYYRDVGGVRNGPAAAQPALFLINGVCG